MNEKFCVDKMLNESSRTGRIPPAGMITIHGYALKSHTVRQSGVFQSNFAVQVSGDDSHGGNMIAAHFFIRKATLHLPESAGSSSSLQEKSNN